MRIGVAGSVGLDHLMTFSGKFTDSLVAGSLEKVSLSFLVDDLEVRRGGCAANMFWNGNARPQPDFDCSCWKRLA